MNKNISPEQKINIYCDVDGVINVYHNHVNLSRKIIKRKLPSIGKVLPQVPLPFKWYENILEIFVQNIVSHDFIQFHWLTTWNHQAVELVEPLTGIKSSGYINYQMTLKEVNNQSQKYELLKKHQTVNPSPFIWIDDIATKEYREEDWVTPDNNLIITPQTQYGLTQKHVEQIEEFINKFKQY